MSNAIMKNDLQKRYLILSDFDGTLFDTFGQSPGKMDVRQAYRLAIKDELGESAANTFLYADWSASPFEIVSYILRGQENPDIASITGRVVEGKLNYLLQEIGKIDNNGNMWPQPLEGVLDFLGTIKTLREQGMPLDFGIVSSGHEAFIKKVFEVWGIDLPQILVTDDDIRGRKFPKEEERRSKPGQLPLAIAHHRWMRRHNEDPLDKEFVAGAIDAKQRIIYIGDDPHRDTHMAHEAGIKTYLVPYTPWQEITKAIITKRELFDGRPVEEIFSETRNGIEIDILLPDNLAKGGKERK